MNLDDFKKMIPNLQPPMQRMAESLLHDEAAAEDLVQDLFVQLWERRSQLRHVTNMEAYCITLVRWRALDQCRKALPPLTRLDANIPDIADHSDSFPEELYQSVLQQIGKLPPGDQELLRLRYVEELPTRQISQLMHQSENNTRVKLTRILKKIRKENGYK